MKTLTWSPSLDLVVKSIKQQEATITKETISSYRLSSQEKNNVFRVMVQKETIASPPEWV